MLDFLFSSFKLYRKLKGGKWYQVSPKPDPSVTVWVRNPNSIEVVWKEESY